MTQVLIRRLMLLLLTGILWLQSAYANASAVGINLTYPIIASEPENLHGYRISLNYQPERFTWSYIKIYFDGSFGHWWDNTSSMDAPTNSSLNIYSIAPVMRLFYQNNTIITPFLDLSIGFSYLSETRIYKRNLGMHFSFQDQAAIGAIFGKEHQFLISFGALHYSNGSLCSRNSGMTVPLFINAGYRF